jgi:lysophospholipase L1-like esterase
MLGAWPGRLVAVSAGLGIVLLVELGLRLSGSTFETHRSFQFVAPELTTGDAQGAPLLQDPDLFWRLKPASPIIEDAGEGGRISEAGFRGALVPPARQPGVLRVAFLGDSSTYGVGVPFRDTYAAKARVRLQECLRRPVEILNGGTHGYSSLQGRVLLAKSVVPLRPDVVAFYFGAWNDFTPAIGGSDADKLLAARGWRSAGLSAIRSLRLYQFLERGVHRVLSTHPGSAERDRRARYVEEFRRGQQPEGPRVSPREFHENLTAMVSLSRSHGIQPVLITPPLSAPAQEEFPFYAAYRGVVQNVGEEHRVPIVRAAEELGTHEAAGEPVFSDWVHPSAAGHERIATQVSAVLAPLLASATDPPGGAAVAPPPCRSPTSSLPGRVHFLLRDFSSATFHGPAHGFVKRVSVDIAGERRYALLLHPESSIEFPRVRLGKHPSLRFGIGIIPAAWDRGTDGVEFRVLLRTAGGVSQELYRRYLDPRGQPADRKWIDESIALDAFSGQEIHVILRTGPNPRGIPDFDWAVWSGPVVVVEHH